MKTSFLLPLTASVLFAACTGSMLMSAQTAGPATARVASVPFRIVDLPAVAVRPDPADLAYWQAHRGAKIVDLPAVVVHPDPADRIVDLAAVTVRPDPADLTAYQDSRQPKIVDLPAVIVRPDVEALPVETPVIAAALLR